MKIKSLLRTYTIVVVFVSILVFTIPSLSKSVIDKVLIISNSAILAGVFLFGCLRILNGIQHSQSRFNALFFGMMGLRMIIALILIVIYLLISDVINISGAIIMICTYFVYMGFEIQFILPKLRTDSEKSKNTDDARK